MPHLPLEIYLLVDIDRQLNSVLFNYYFFSSEISWVIQYPVPVENL